MSGNNWIETLNKGGLHRSLGVPSGQPIPAQKQRAAVLGEDGKIAQKQARAAVTLKKLSGNW